MSKALATKNVAALLLSVAMVFGVTFAFASPAKAQTLESLQAQIAALLAQISALQGGTTTGGSCTTFTRNHQMGDTGGEVMAIQKFLNSNGAVIASSGAGSPGNETSYFGGLTRAAVAKFQAANGITPAAGYWGPISRAKANSMCTGTPTVPGVPITGNGLKVMLASDSPVNVALVAGQAIGELAKFVFVNPTGSPVTVTSASFQRIGVSSDSTLTAVYLYNGATRVTDSAAVNTGMFTFSDSAGLFVVPAGSSVTISVRSNINTGTSGEQVGVQLNSLAASGTLDTSVVFPIRGGIQTISSASLGTVAMTYSAPSGSTENPGTDIRVFEASTVISTHAANLRAITFENRGSSSDGDLRNFKLYVDGVQVGSTVAQSSNDKVTFDLSSSPKRLETGTRIIKVVADIVDGSSETFDIQVRRAADAMFVDAELGQPILMTGTFAAGSANTIASGTLSITKAANSPTENIAVGATNVLLARYEVRAAGESIKVEAIKVWVDQGAADGMDNAKVFLNGSQIGSTKDLTSGANPDVAGTEFTFGSSFIARAGMTEILEIYGDAKTNDSVNYASGTSVDVGVSIAAASDTEGMSSGNTISAISEVEGNSRSITSSTLTGSKASGYGDQTMIPGTNNAKIGSFTLSAGSTEAVNINTIAINLSSTEAASITDLRLVDASTGTQIGSTKVSPSGSSGDEGDNSFSVNIVLPASGSKTIDLVANIKSNAGIGAFTAALDDSTGGTGASTAQSVTIGNDATLQTITIGSGTLNTAVGVSPDDANVIAGSTDVKVGNFKFTAQNSSFTVQEIKVKVPANAATSVSAVTLKYKDAAGVTQSASQALTLSSGTQTYATATFTGLTFYVPQNTEGVLDVYVNIPTIASGATTGRGITVVLDGNEGFKAIDSAGTQTTALTSSTDLSSVSATGKGTMYVRKSKPTLAAVTLDSSTLSAGANQVIARFSITADAAGDIGWKYLSFTVNKTAAVTLDATTTIDIYEGSNAIAGNWATTTGSFPTQSQMFTTAATSGNLVFEATSEQQIAAGTTATYEIRTTVGGLASGSNLSVTLANPSSSISTDQYSDILGNFGDATPSIIWTDRSSISTVHSESTDDWTNDYLVKTLPLTVGNKSVAF